MLNHITAAGRLTKDPELRRTQNGVAVASFTIACDRDIKGASGNKQTDFIDCVAWRQTAEFISRYFHKGSMIAIEGTIQTSNYTDKNGNNRKQTEVLANNVSFCGSKSESGNAASTGGYNEPAPSYASTDNSDFEEIVDDNDDLPF